MKKISSYLPNVYQLTLIFLNLPRPFLWFLLHYGFCKLLSACTILLHPATGGQALFQPKHIHLVTNDRRRIRRFVDEFCAMKPTRRKEWVSSLLSMVGASCVCSFLKPINIHLPCTIFFAILYCNCNTYLWINNIYHIAIDISSAYN